MKGRETFYSTNSLYAEHLYFQVIRMKSTLERFHLAKLNPLKDKLQQHHYSMDVSILIGGSTVFIASF